MGVGQRGEEGKRDNQKEDTACLTQVTEAEKWFDARTGNSSHTATSETLSRSEVFTTAEFGRISPPSTDLRAREEGPEPQGKYWLNRFWLEPQSPSSHLPTPCDREASRHSPTPSLHR